MLPFGALFGRSDAPDRDAATSSPSSSPQSPLLRGSAGTRTATPEPAPAPHDAGGGANPWEDFLAAMRKGTLTDREERELRPKLVEAFLHSSDSLDELLSNTNAQHAQAQIWSTIDEDDARTLTDALLMLARKSAPVAGVVRMVADSWLGIRALQILGPRLWSTALWYPQHGGFAL